MATAARAIKQTQNALVRPYIVDATQTVTVGMTVIFSTDEFHVKGAGGASDLEIGICLPSPDANASGVVAAGKTVEIAMLGWMIIPMVVGTGNCTAGKKQVIVATGITDAAASGGGTTAVECVGIALQTGVANDIIGVLIGGPNSRVSA